MKGYRARQVILDEDRHAGRPIPNGKINWEVPRRRGRGICNSFRQRWNVNFEESVQYPSAGGTGSEVSYTRPFPWAKRQRNRRLNKIARASRKANRK